MMSAEKKKPEDKNTDTMGSTHSMRADAEEQLVRSPKSSSDLKGQTSEQLIHELQVHQIELDIKAEELSESRIALENSRDKYLDLYDFAPIGYFTLNDKALIVDVNLTGATLIGAERSKLFNARFRKFISQNDNEQWIEYFTNVLNHEEKQICTLNLKRGDCSTFPARLEGVRLTDSDGATTVRIAISDITDIWQIEALNESEEKYRTLIDTLNEGIWVIDKNEITTFVNPKMAMILGYNVEGMTGRSLFSFMDEEGRRICEQNLKRRQQGIKEQHYFEFLKKDGVRIYASLEATPLKGKDGEYIGAIAGVTDITERKRAMEKIQDSEKQLKESQRVGHLGSWSLNVVTGDLQWSDESYRIFGLSPQEFVPDYENFQSIVHPEDLRFVQEQIDAALNDDKHYDIDFRFVRPDGETGWIHCEGEVTWDADGKPLLFFGTQIDITERKRAEEVLRKSEHFVSSILESTPNLIYIYDLNEHRNVFANKEIVNFLGYSSEQILALGSALFENILHPNDVQTVAHHHARMKAAKDGDVFECEYRMKHAKGTWRILRSRDVAFSRDSQGMVHQILGSTEDITERKRAEEALRVSEVTFRTLIEASPDAIVFSDLEGNVLMQNRMAEILVGYDDGNLETGTNIQSFFPQEELGRLAKNTQIVLEQGSIHNIEYTLIRKDGTHVLVELNSSMVKDPVVGQQRFVTVLRDITERKLAEENLRIFKDLVEHSSDAIGMATPEGRHYYQNEAFERIFGNIGDYPETIYVDKAIGKQVLDTIRGGGKWEGEVKMFGKDRTILDIFLRTYAIQKQDGRIIGLIGLHTDITKRKQVEEALEESEERFRKIFENSPVGMTLVKPDFQFFSVNQTWRSMTGYSEEELLKMSFQDITHPDYISGDMEHIRELMAGTIPVYITEKRYIRKDGSILWGLIKVTTIRDQNGTLRYFGAQIEDITERKKAEQTIRHALAEKEILLREIHHRVKNNLAGIISLINLQTSSLTDPDQIYLLKDLETRIRSMALVHESLYQTKDIAHISLATYTENLTRYLFQVYETGTSVRCRIEMGDITMPIETATPCGLVMTEIITNSLKYAFPKTFSCEEIRKEPCTITITIHREGSDYLLTVADNGVGIPKGTDATTQTSLGLYLIGFIVKHQLRGNTEVSTGNGTSYTIRFPEPKSKERPTNE